MPIVKYRTNRFPNSKPGIIAKTNAKGFTHEHGPEGLHINQNL